MSIKNACVTSSKKGFLFHFLICVETINQANSFSSLQIDAESLTTSLIFNQDIDGFKGQSRIKAQHSQDHTEIQYISRLNKSQDVFAVFVSWKFLLESVLRATFNPKTTRSDTEQQQLIIIIFLLPWPSSSLSYHVLPTTNLLVKLGSLKASFIEKNYILLPVNHCVHLNHHY